MNDGMDWDLVDRFSRVFDEKLHPRGQPKNKGEFRRKTGTAAVGFASPNTGNPASFEEASSRLGTKKMGDWVATIRAGIERAGLHAHIMPAIGDWHAPGEDPGAEESAEIEFDKAPDYDAVKYAMAQIGRLSQQFAVLPFVDDKSGPDTLWELEIPDSPAEIRKHLDEIGLAYRTLVPHKGGTRLVIFDQGSQNKELIKKVAGIYGVTAEYQRGRGEFFPPNAESRADAVAQYSKFIEYYEAKYRDRGRWSRVWQGYYATGPDAWLRGNGLSGRLQSSVQRYRRKA